MKKFLHLLNLQLFAMIQHSDVDALIPEGEVKEIFQGIEKESQVFKLLTRLPNMSSNRTRIKVLDSLPIAYWQGSSTAFKKTSKQAWKNKYLVAEEIAVIIPIAEADLDDAEYDIWGQVKPKIVEAISKMVDKVVLFGGEDKPESFPDSILASAFEKGFVREKDNAETIYNAISETMGLVEDSGYSVNGLLAGPGIKKVFRGMTDTTGQLITGDEISALPRAIVENGAWDKDKAIAVVGDFKQGVFSIRQDITYKLLTEGVIQDPSDGSIVYNLAQQDMVALRVTFRFAWQLPNPVNRLAEDEEGRLPFAVVAPASSAKLTVSLTPGEATSFDSTQVVKMSANARGAKIYYTDNGSTPTSASTLYSGQITLSATKTIKAIAIKDGYTNSDVVSVTYTKNWVLAVNPVDSSETVLGKLVGDLQEDVEINGNEIVGTLPYVTGYTQFSGAEEEQEGNYLVLKAESDDGATITAELVGGTLGRPVTLDSDGIIVIRIGNTSQTIRFIASKGGRSTTKVFSLTGLVLESATA